MWIALIGAATVGFLGWLAYLSARHRDESVERIARLEASRADSTESVARVLAESFTSMFATLYGPREAANQPVSDPIVQALGESLGISTNGANLPPIVEEWRDWTDDEYPTPTRSNGAIVGEGQTWRDVAGLEEE